MPFLSEFSTLPLLGLLPAEAHAWEMHCALPLRKQTHVELAVLHTTPLLPSSVHPSGWPSLFFFNFHACVFYRNRSFTDHARFHEMNCEVFAVLVDSHFSHHVWISK